MAMIPANDLRRQFELHASEYEEKAVQVLRSGWYILGNEVKAFEQEFAAYTGAKHCVGLASGLDALILAFRLLNIGEGDEVIVCANAYIACVMGITVNGAKPVFVEPDEYDNLANSFSLSKVPTTIFYTEGVRLRTIEGAYTADSVRAFLQGLLSQDDQARGTAAPVLVPISSISN